MILTTETLVLRTVKYGDRKVVVETFSRKAGSLAFVASVAAGRKGAGSRRLFQPLALLDVTVDMSAGATLHKLKEASIAYPYATLIDNPYKLSIALFVAEFLCRTVGGEQENGLLYEYVADSLQWLDRVERGFSNFHLVFLMRLTRFFGFYPNVVNYCPGDCFDLRQGCFCHVRPPHHEFIPEDDASKISLFLRMDFSTMHLYKMSGADRNRLLDILVDYYRIHIPNFRELKSLEVVRELFR